MTVLERYVTPGETDNGQLGYCAHEPTDLRGVPADRFPVAVIAHSVITPARVDEWGAEHVGVEVCPEGWGPEREFPWCEDGEGCRVLSYAADMRAGDVFPPIVVVWENAGWVVEDGYHRLAAWVLNGATTVPAVMFADGGPDEIEEVRPR